MRHATAGWVGVLTAAAFGCVSDTIAQSECENNLLLATTNQSELVEIDIRLPFSHVELIGPTNPDGPGWTGLSFDFEGSLFVTSRHTSHTAIDGCFGFYGGLDTDGGCSHLFRVLLICDLAQYLPDSHPLIQRRGSCLQPRYY